MVIKNTPPKPYRSQYRPSVNTMNGMQQRFVEEYLIDLNVHQAAIRAGYASTKATSAGASLLKFAPIREAIAKAMAERSKRVGLNQDRVLFELGKLVVGDTRAVFNPDGTLRAPHEMDDYAAPMISGVKTRRVVELDENGKPQKVEMQEVKLVDRIGAIALAMRHLGMMNDKLDINITSLADRMLAAQMRTGMKALGVTIDGEMSDDDQAALQQELIGYERTIQHEYQELDEAVETQRITDKTMNEEVPTAYTETFEDLI